MQIAGARDAINSWVAAHTGQLIRNLMPPGAITPQTMMVLANAIYLKALWTSPFAKTATVPPGDLRPPAERIHMTFSGMPR